MKSFFRYFFLFVILIITISCTKVIAYGATNTTTALSHSYASNISLAMMQTKKALENLGYNILRDDEYRNRIVTAWTATTSDSHYLEYFNRKDFGASAGSYYQVTADIFEDASQVKVSIATTVKSISGKLKSSHVVEKKILKRIDDFMRSPQIEINNVGMKEK